MLAVLCGIATVHGRTIQLNWTSDGVRDYTSTPLRLALGDMLELICNENRSNLFIQAERIQYDSCNASAGSGVFNYNGLCFPTNPVLLTFTENSQPLDNTVNFVNDHAYFLTSYSEGDFRALDHTFTSGGQCEDGLKMIIVIGEASVPTSGGDDPGTGGDTATTSASLPHSQGLNDNNKSSIGGSLYIIIGAVAGGVLLLAGLLIMIIIIVCVKKGCCSREGKTKRSRTHGNSSTPASFFNGNLYNTSGTDSQACTLMRADYNQGSKPVIEVKVEETTEQGSGGDDNLQTFGVKKSLGSVDHLFENQHYRSANRNFDDATGQPSTPFHANTTPEHLLKAKSTSEISSAGSSNPLLGKPKPLPPPKRRLNGNDMLKASSADNLISR